MIDSILIWLAETVLGQFFKNLFKPKEQKSVAQAEAENFAKPATGSDDDTINRL